MAPGVKKTYKKLYRRNLMKALDMLCDDVTSEADAESLIAATRYLRVSPTTVCSRRRSSG